MLAWEDSDQFANVTFPVLFYGGGMFDSLLNHKILLESILGLIQ